MKSKHFSYALTFGLSLTAGIQPLYAESPEEFMRRLEEEYAAFGQTVEEEYATFRDKINAEYAEALAAAWTPAERTEPVKRTEEPAPIPEVDKDKEKPVEPEENEAPDPRLIVVEEEVEIPAPAPRPQPQEPIERVPVAPTVADIEVPFYGTLIRVGGVEGTPFRLSAKSKEGLASGWKTLSGKNWNNLINDCLKVREEYCLADWAFIQFLMNLGAKMSSEGSDEQVLLAGFILNQCGYDIRFGNNDAGKLHLLLRMTGDIYNRYGFTVNGKLYYPYEPLREMVYVCDFNTPGEKPLTLALDELPKLDYKATVPREITVHGYPQVQLSLSANKNLIDFYQDYPDGSLNDNEQTRFAFRANTPASPEFREQIYPVLAEKLKGMNQWQGVNFLLKVAQTFPYGYDEEIWGDDRIFWPDESWYYTYSDCEDHALNFTRLVRDLLGLKCALITYPGHLSASVNITDGTESGDYIEYKGDKFTVCDATYFYAGAGRTAKSNENRTAILTPIR